MKPLELYIHIPFCVKKCRYCDFLSAPADAGERQEYIEQLCGQIRSYDKLAEDYHITSIFLGGGTPSILEAGQIRDIFDAVRGTFPVDSDAEITIEVNPGTVDRIKLISYRRAGINRLSIGLQSVHDQELKMLGRIHTFREFQETFTLAREKGFDNINVDLMSGIPFQTLDGWESTLRTVAELGPEHISAYSLIIEEGTPFASRQLNLPDEDTEYNMYEATSRILKEYGYEQYEISNYAKEGRDCRHNVGYWTRRDYLGFGLGASSLYGKDRFANTADMRKYLENSSSPELIREREPVLTREDEMAEFMFLGLRMTKGIAKTDFRQKFGCAIETVYGDVLKKYEAMGLLLEKDGRIFLSREGIHVSNSVMADFLL